MQLVESFNGDFIVTIEGRSYPSECLVEDDDGFRIAIVNDLREISLRVWVALHSAGARHIVSPSGDGWVAILTDTFLEDKEEHGVTYRVSDGWHEFDHFPLYVEVREVHETPPSLSGGFVNLHNHSEFSSLDGLSLVSEIVQVAVDLHQPAVGVTDHGVCAAHPSIQKEADKVGIKPVFGIEANFTDDRFLRGDKEKGNAKQILGDYRHLTMWAMNNTGLRNIWAMNTEGHREGFYGRPRIDWDTLGRFNEGVIVSTACLRGPLAQRILDHDDIEGARAQLARLLGIFGHNLYIELHTSQLPEQTIVNKALVGLASDYSVPLIAVVDSHYPTLDAKGTHKVWLASQTNKDLQDDTYLFAGDTDYHMMGKDEVCKYLSYLDSGVVDEAVSNTLLLSEQCDAHMGEKAQPPVFSRDDTRQEAQRRDVDRLIDLCLSNWHRTGGKTNTQEVFLHISIRYAKDLFSALTSIIL